MTNKRNILVFGGSGFVGSALVPALALEHEVKIASRRPRIADVPGLRYAFADLDHPNTYRDLLAEADVVVHLVHQMRSGGDYAEREVENARTLAREANEAGVERIVYLGGVAPSGRRSRHLEARLETGRALRDGETPVFEMRAGMIIGAGSESWRITRDLAVRLPVMVDAPWLRHRGQPVAIEDVVAALSWAVSAPLSLAGVLDVPGPDTLTAHDILAQTATLAGRPLRSFSARVPPQAAQLAVRLMTRADPSVSDELVLGLQCDLIADGDGVWVHLPDYRRTPFTAAARRALHAERATLSASTRMLERIARIPFSVLTPSS